MRPAASDSDGELSRHWWYSAWLCEVVDCPKLNSHLNVEIRKGTNNNVRRTVVPARSAPPRRLSARMAMIARSESDRTLRVCPSAPKNPFYRMGMLL